MDRALRIRIEERAHAIWEAEGRPEGRAFHHWHQAVSEITAQLDADGGTVVKVPRLPTLSKEQLDLIDDYFEHVKRRELVFLLAGETGVGKSSTINTLLDKEIAAVSDMEPCTTSVVPYYGEVNGIRYRIYDTPGLCDGKDRDESYLAMIKTVCEVDCFWFVTRLDRARESHGREDESIRLITEDLGQDIWKHAIIVFTHAGNVKRRYSGFLNDRAFQIRKYIGKYASASSAEQIPAVAVDNFSSELPDGREWLGELYLTMLKRIRAHGVLSFELSVQNRVKKKDADATTSSSYSGGATSAAGSSRPQSSGARVKVVNTINLTTTQAAEASKTLSAKVQTAISEHAKSTGRATAVAAAAAGAAIGAVIAGPIGAAVGGVIGGLVGWFSSKK